MGQDGGDVQPVGTGHTVVALVTRNGRILVDQVGRFIQELFLLFLQFYQGGIGADVVLQMLQIGHATEAGQYLLV